MNPLNLQQGNPSYRMEAQAVTPRSSSFRRASQARNSFRASAENRVPPYTADGQYQVSAAQYISLHAPASLSTQVTVHYGLIR